MFIYPLFFTTKYANTGVVNRIAIAIPREPNSAASGIVVVVGGTFVVEVVVDVVVVVDP